MSGVAGDDLTDAGPATGGGDDDAVERDLGAARPAHDDAHSRLVRAQVAARLFGRPRDPVTVDRFALLERIGRGAMGDVFAAFDPRLDRRVALKLVAGADPGARATLLDEARAAARLAHPAVVTVFDAGEHAGGVWVAMELVAGDTLRAWAPGKPAAAVLAVARQIARGLAAAHRAGCVHRDVKPDNVLVTDDVDGPRARLADFGVAVVDAAAAAMGRAGSPAYMAPEQKAGAAATAASDQFAFATTMWEALTGARPDAASGASAAPAGVARVLRRALAVAADARWPSMTALADALDRELDRASARRRTLVALGVAGLAAAAATTGAVILRGDGGPAPDPCAAAAAELDPIWPGRRDATLGGLGAAPGYGPATAATTVAAVERWAASWRTARTGLCTGARTGAVSPALLDERAACLARQREHVATLIAGLATGAAERAVDATASLPAPDDCERTRVREPVAPAERATARDLIERADRARAAIALGQLDDASAALGDAMAAAERLGHAPTRAAVLAVAGLLADRRGQPAEAATLLEAAAAAAIAGEDARSLSRAAVALVFTVGAGLRQPEAAARWIELADAALTASGRVPAEVATLRDHTGVVHTVAGRLDQARAAHLDALAQLEAAHGRAHPDRVRILANLALAEQHAGRHADGLVHLDEAVDLAERTHGPGHPILGHLHTNRAMARWDLGDRERSLRDLEHALAIKEASFGPDHSGHASTLVNIGLVLGELGRLAEAVAPLERAIALRTRALGDHHRALLDPYVNLAFTYLELGRAQPARAAAGRALALAGDDAARAAFPLVLAAWAELIAGDRAAALQLLARADAAASHLDGLERAQLDLVAARVLGRGDRRARARARAALAVFRADASLPSSPRFAAELEAWLADR